MATAKLSEYRKHIADAAARLVQSGILTKSNHGNISAKIPGSDTFLLTSVSNLAQITMDNIGLFDLDNNLLDGSVMPISAEIIPMHGIVYKTRPDAGGALHTHSPFATAFAVASKAIPVSYEPMVRFGMTDGVPVAEYGPRGSQESVDNIELALNGVDNLRGILLGEPRRPDLRPRRSRSGRRQPRHGGVRGDHHVLLQPWRAEGDPGGEACRRAPTPADLRRHRRAAGLAASLRRS